MILPIVKYGDPVLRAKGKRVVEVNAHTQELISNMIETMHAANGVGLAAHQIGQALQLTVIDISGAEDRESALRLNGAETDPNAIMPLILLNPKMELVGETVSGAEGCLSFPEISGEIDRAEAVRVQAETPDGAAIEIEASGFLARVLQHEIDHLNGILFIDRMSSGAKVSLASRLKRLQRETQKL